MEHMKFRLYLWVMALGIALSACKPATSSSTSTDSTPKPVVDPVPPADQPKAVLETLSGTYITTETGDYLHAVIKGDDNTEYSFFLSEDFPEARVPEMMEGLWDGKAVKVQWRKVERDIPEAGGRIEIDEIVSIEAI
jgi:hypothetical protein